VLNVTQDHIERSFTIARWYGRRAWRAEISDLESAALEGLAKAARDWDPEKPGRSARRARRRRSFWTFAFIKIVGEMRDELRRFDHLTRSQRAWVSDDEQGALAVERQGLDWMNPQEPVSLDATVATGGDEDSCPLVELIEQPHDPIAAFELRDAVCRAGAALPERMRFVFVKTEVEGYSNGELADAFAVTEGRASQLRGAAFEKLRKEIGDSFLDAG
jgi:RNA polymerase sigma factor (sigma-70 family)